jgi:peptidoglycan hydrolase-like protein with peptidoglycan-binding domain
MNNNPNYLKIGDKSANVIKLQKLLIKKGYQLKETGVFDPDTFRAVSDLQKSVGLDVDGIASKQV